MGDQCRLLMWKKMDWVTPEQRFSSNMFIMFVVKDGSRSYLSRLKTSVFTDISSWSRQSYVPYDMHHRPTCRSPGGCELLTHSLPVGDDKKASSDQTINVCFLSCLLCSDNLHHCVVKSSSLLHQHCRARFPSSWCTAQGWRRRSRRTDSPPRDPTVRSMWGDAGPSGN